MVIIMPILQKNSNLQLPKIISNHQNKKEKQKKEEEILKLCPNKKAPIKQIKEISEKMYDEAMKRIIKKKTKN